MSFNSDFYRDNVANMQTHTFSLTGRQLNKAIRAIIDAYFPDATKAKKKKVLDRCQKPMNIFIKNVGDRVRSTSKTSEGIRSIKITKRSVVAVLMPQEEIGLKKYTANMLEGLRTLKCLPKAY